MPKPRNSFNRQRRRYCQRQRDSKRHRKCRKSLRFTVRIRRESSRWPKISSKSKLSLIMQMTGQLKCRISWMMSKPLPGSRTRRFRRSLLRSHLLNGNLLKNSINWSPIAPKRSNSSRRTIWLNLSLIMRRSWSPNRMPPLKILSRLCRLRREI